MRMGCDLAAGGHSVTPARADRPRSTRMRSTTRAPRRVGDTMRRVGGAVHPACLLVLSAPLHQAVTVPTDTTRETEVKYRVRGYEDLLQALARRGVHLGPPVTQDDQAYARKGWRYGDNKAGVPFVRLRTQDGHHLFTMKRPVENELSCIEHETQVADRDAMHYAILAMGFYPTVRILKTRRIGRYGSLSLCLDDVSSIGWFFEVEDLAASAEALADQARMHRFVSSLGVGLERMSVTYDSLVREAQLVAV